MNIWGAKRDLTKQDVMIRLCEATNENEEVEYVYKEALKGVNVGEVSAILFPSRDSITKFTNLVLIINKKSQWSTKQNQWGSPDFRDLNQHLRNSGIKLQFIGSGYGSLEDAQKNKEAIIMTYHSSKGLDFDNVFLPFLNNTFFICRDRDKERILFMVAMTRSKKNLYLTYFGCTHRFVDIFKSDCTEISIANILNPTITNNANTNPFDY
jgi:hypothetical protein